MKVIKHAIPQHNLVFLYIKEPWCLNLFHAKFYNYLKNQISTVIFCIFIAIKKMYEIRAKNVHELVFLKS